MAAKHRSKLAVPLALLLGLGAAPVSAERWWIQPAANLQLGYEDNVRLTSGGKQGDILSRLTAALRASRSSEVSDVAFSIGLAGTRYADLSDLDNTSSYAGIDLGHRLERQQFRLGTRYDSQSTLTSEEATTGLVQVNRQQTRWSVTPGWSYLLTERVTLDLGASYVDVSYDDVALLPLNDYRTGSVDLGLGYSLTERLGLNARIGYGRYEASGRTNESENVSLMAGGEYLLSEKASLSALVGIRQTEQTVEGLGGTLTEDSSGPSYSLSYARSFERGGGLTLAARRELTPGGASEVLDTTGILASLSYPLHPRWQFSLAASAYRNRQPGGEAGGSDRDFFSVTPRLSYDLAETWRIGLEYRFRWQQYDQISGLDQASSDAAISNAVFLSLNWTRPWDL